MNSSINTHIKIISSVAAAGLTILGLAASASAAPPSDSTVLSKTVDYSDLNLQGAAGAKVLYARIRNAANEVCAPLANTGIKENGAWQSCVESAISTSVSQVNSSLVTTLHHDTTKAGRIG